MAFRIDYQGEATWLLEVALHELITDPGWVVEITRTDATTLLGQVTAVTPTADTKLVTVIPASPERPHEPNGEPVTIDIDDIATLTIP